MSLRPLILAFCLALASLPAFAEQAAFTHFSGFDDTNGNGQLDCGEPVTIEAGYFSRNGAPRTSGTIDAPTPATVGLSYLGGSAFVTPDRAVGCMADLTSGLDPPDTAFSADFTCDPAISNPPDQNFVSITYKAIYVARAGNPGFTSSVLVQPA